MANKDAEILRDCSETWGVRNALELKDGHGIEVLRLTLLDLADTRPQDARSPGGLFVTRLHQVVARQRAAVSTNGSTRAAAPDIPIPDSDPEIDLGELWINSISVATIAPNAKRSSFGPDGVFKLIAFSVEKVAVVEVLTELYIDVFNLYGGAIQRALGAEEIRLVVK